MITITFRNDSQAEGHLAEWTLETSQPVSQCLHITIVRCPWKSKWTSKFVHFSMSLQVNALTKAKLWHSAHSWPFQRICLKNNLLFLPSKRGGFCSLLELKLEKFMVHFQGFLKVLHSFIIKKNSFEFTRFEFRLWNFWIRTNNCWDIKKSSNRTSKVLFWI